MEKITFYKPSDFGVLSDNFLVAIDGELWILDAHFQRGNGHQYTVFTIQLCLSLT